MSTVWNQGRFRVSAGEGCVRWARGFHTDDLGLELAIKASPRGRRKPYWVLYHLNTGHRIVVVQADENDALSLASEIASLADWSFVSLEGWRDRCPDLPDRVREVADASALFVQAVNGNGQCQDAARQIAMARA